MEVHGVKSCVHNSFFYYSSSLLNFLCNSPRIFVFYFIFLSDSFLCATASFFLMGTVKGRGNVSWFCNCCMNTSFLLSPSPFLLLLGTTLGLFVTGSVGSVFLFFCVSLIITTIHILLFPSGLFSFLLYFFETVLYTYCIVLLI